MEDLQPISAAEQSAFCVEMLKRLNIQRKQDYLWDITLVSKDNGEFKAHRNVLSAVSPFFCKLLQSDMKENREGIIRFEEISGSVMEDVLEFIYTGTVEVTQENANDLIAAGNYLMIPSLKTVSGRFLEGEMSNSNCISTFYLAEKYDCIELVGNSGKFIRDNFVSVGEMDEFLSLEANEVASWISSDEIAVGAEVDVFKIIVQWVERSKSERKAEFEELFGRVRLDFLTRDCLQDVVTNELVRGNAVCLRLTVDAIVKMATFASEDDLPQPPRKGLETRVILACGGKYTFFYLPEKDQWKRLPDGSTERNQKTQMISFRDQLYTFKKFSKAEKYDLVFNGWSKSDLIDVSADNAIVTVVKGDMYAIEVNRPAGKSTIKRFDVELCTWQTVVESPQGCRNGSFVVASGSHLYLLGGSAPNTSCYVAKVERFNIEENQWEEIADMQQGRGGAFGVATEEKVFVAGGLNEENKVSRRCEMYNVSTNEWHFIGSLNTWRVYGSMVCLNGILYVLGGTKNNRDRLLSVECYDSTEDKWIEKTSIPVQMYASGNQNTFTGCVMKLSKGVLKKPDFIKEEVVTPATAQPAFNFPSVTRSSFPVSTSMGSVNIGANSGNIFGNQVSATSISQRVVARPIPVFELSDDDD
ncbi:kelch-like protein 12 [Stylophora pistillata]|uniref:kelch-like protein 12 n=1 Tax=Stylophora pistillata TaxID=50429 RepID=UPI000C0527D0|nr:kelch-like protein 12 [Stylophora pistillata]